MGESNAPFSVEVSSEAWRAEADRWIAESLAGRDVVVVGTRQPRVRPWSTQLVVEVAGPSGAARYWFKANCRAQSFEPALQARLATLLPGDVDAPIAADPSRGWMLTADRGATLADRHDPAAEDWSRVIDEWARVQRSLAGRSAEVLGAGVPDCSPGTVPARFAELLGLVLALPTGHPSAPDAATAASLVAAADRVALAAEALDEGGLPATLQHGDLHPGNVFASDDASDGLRLFDFGDAQWAHPVEALLVPRAVMEYRGIDPEPVVAGFREAWADVARFDDAEWARLVAAAETTHAVNRAHTWWGCLAQATDDETAEWGEAVLRHLSRVLGPSGDS
ncbi:phosphotransferase [Agromyces sp. S2-1-8]|jgi:hypothetical protein|uniref:phosphotransferase n=1 Tax=unclassified Agromyces TaxID=2639701 RepID=UPI001E45F7B4|nr:phosphotransferase [Agromyces sp. S2-1-8]MCD5347606.1 aminoglycoside phosphotransferase family protein [Agromyces sp. S2-1-8]